MYCYNCGAKVNGKFCHRCGHPVGDPILETPPEIKNTHKSKKTILLAIAIVMGVLLVVAMCCTWYYHKQKIQREIDDVERVASLDPENEAYTKAVTDWEEAVTHHPLYQKNPQKQHDYYYAIIHATSAVKESDWDSVIENMNTAIDIVSDIPENYVTLATAYVEKLDLYQANVTLHRGYNITADQSLQNVSIGGPVSAIETAYYMVVYDSAITRCKYVFSDYGISSYVYTSVRPFGGARYIFEETKINQILFWHYDSGSTVLDDFMYPDHFQGLPLFESWDTYFDLEYNTENKISKITYDGKTFVKLKYTDGKCTSMTATRDFNELFVAGDKLSFVYDDCGNIADITYTDKSVTFEHEKDGSYHAVFSSPIVKIRYGYDCFGLCVERSYMDNNSELLNYTSTSKNGQILSYDCLGYHVAFGYEDGKVVSVEKTEMQSGDTVKIYYIYNYVYDGTIRLAKIRYITETNDEYEILFIYSSHDYNRLYDGGFIYAGYKNDGLLIQIYDGLTKQAISLMYSYTEEKLLYYDIGAYRYNLEYDEDGRYLRTDCCIDTTKE